MTNYKISGYVTEACDIRLMRGNSFLGHRESVPAGAYELIFTLDSIESIDVVAVRSDGKIVGYGGITPVETADGSNITIPVMGGIKSIQQIYDNNYSDATNLSWQININEVDSSKSLIYAFSSGNGYRHTAVLPTFINSTTIQLERTYAAQGAQTYIQIVEFYNCNVQRGQVFVWQSTTSNITAVDTTKAYATMSGFTTNSSTANMSTPTCYLYSSSQVKHAGYNYQKMAWQVIEFE